MKKEFSKKDTLMLKGIAIIMMIIHHSVVYKNNYNVSFFPFCERFVVDLSVMFRICVSFYVFLTGYGLVLSYKNKGEESDKLWIIKRLLKLYASFWIIALLTFILCECISGYTSQVFFKNGFTKGIIQMIEEFFCLTTQVKFNGHWWYMNIAVLYVCSIPIFEKLFKKYSYSTVLLMVVILPRILRLEISRSSYIAFLIPMLLGMIFAKENLLVKISNCKLNNNNYINKTIKFVIESILMVIFFILYKNMHIETYYEINYGIIPIFMICYLYEFILDIPILKNVLAYLGKHSMNIYFIHYFIRLYAIDWLYSFGNWIYISMALLISSLLVSIIIELLKKLIRYDKFIGKIQKYIENKAQKQHISKNTEKDKELETISL